jgi:Uma2 family endonuclease
MGEPVKRRATYEDLLAVPEGLVAEILDGELVTQPRPAARHALASSVLGGELGPPFHRGKGGPGGWILLYEPELHLGADVLVPDYAGWRRERMPEVPGTAALDLAPDWACEVLSPSTAGVDRVRKMPIYARERVGHLWLIDPEVRTLEAYRLESGRWVLLGAWSEDARVRVEPFEAIELELGALWAA